MQTLFATTPILFNQSIYVFVSKLNDCLSVLASRGGIMSSACSAITEIVVSALLASLLFSYTMTLFVHAFCSSRRRAACFAAALALSKDISTSTTEDHGPSHHDASSPAFALAPALAVKCVDLVMREVSPARALQYHFYCACVNVVHFELPESEPIMICVSDFNIIRCHMPYRSKEGFLVHGFDVALTFCPECHGSGIPVLSFHRYN